MKFNFLKIFVLASICLFTNHLFAQTEVFKCDEARYFDHHSSDQIFNNLIDSACIALNKSNYEVALSLINSAVILDSTKNGAPDIYIASQRNKLNKFIISQKEKASELPATNESSIDKVNEVKEETKVEKSAIKEEPKVVETNKTEAIKEEPVNVEKEDKKLENEVVEKIEPSTNNEIKNNIEAPSIQSNLKTESTENLSNRTEEKATPPTEQNLNSSEQNVSSYQTNSPTATLESPKENEPIAPINTEESKSTENVDPFVETSSKSSNLTENSKTFSESVKGEFQEKGLQKVSELETYIKQIGDKSTSQSIAEEVTNSAIGLFDSEDRVVQVSSINNPAKVRLKVRKYLEKLRLLDYDNVRIEWADFQYTSDFIKGDDGNYHGYVIFRQRFSATKDNIVVYSDLTTKKAEVILKLYHKAVDGIETEKWDVFLGDISVEQTKKD